MTKKKKEQSHMESGFILNARAPKQNTYGPLWDTKSHFLSRT